MSIHKNDLEVLLVQIESNFVRCRIILVEFYTQSLQLLGQRLRPTHKHADLTRRRHVPLFVGHGLKVHLEIRPAIVRFALETGPQVAFGGIVLDHGSRLAHCPLCQIDLAGQETARVSKVAFQLLQHFREPFVARRGVAHPVEAHASQSHVRRLRRTDVLENGRVRSD